MLGARASARKKSWIRETSLPLYALFEFCERLAFLWFSKNVQMFVAYQEEVVAFTSPFLPRGFHFPLQFYDILAKNETDVQK